MSRLALHPNDAGITLLDEQRIGYREPGFALLDKDELVLGNAAFQKARIKPRGIQHRYWSQLTTAPLADRHFGNLTTADLASRQLEQLWQRAGVPRGELVVAVPAYMQTSSLGLLLGIAAELEIQVVAMLDAAVAATRREYVNAVPVHIDMGLHATTLTRLLQQGQVQVEKTEVLDDCGAYALYETWLNAIAEAFVQQSRFDPLHTAETEQMLLDKLPAWLAQASRQDSVALEIEYSNLTHRAELESLSLVGAAAPYYQLIASKLRALYRAGEVPALQVTDRVARLPGLGDLLKARVGGEVFALEPGATARGALARVREPGGAETGISLRRQLPWDQSAFEVKPQDEDHGDGSAPTHLLFRHQAYRIDDRPLVVGSQAMDGGRVLVLGSDMPGVSRRHCTLVHADGRCVVEDSSRYGTFLNGHRISGSTVLQVGDTLRVGSPGFELELITTEGPHGA
jgi:hypothetical protein